MRITHIENKAIICDNLQVYGKLRFLKKLFYQEIRNLPGTIELNYKSKNS
ncbi:protein of unknown function [Bartonella clarridgeiae 73]|uniref:Uncharacterized protein n=1 Tax=Bartonella clarridgeiae (strain CCUG 45776 / CIP 104772 / 73) TaxID=696125 RepID=E6YJH7_BARC7|nr:MAG: hypothetical protein PG977_001144 [Bartonella clarridgeiae]CBI77015.1 protein of unknown function [Bartonella clarridgeiae 73]